MPPFYITRPDGRNFEIGRDTYWDLRKSAKESVMGRYWNVTGEFNEPTAKDVEVRYPVNIKVGDLTFTSPEQYHDFFNALVYRKVLTPQEVDDTLKINFMGKVLKCVESAYLYLYNTRRIVKDIQLGLTEGFCEKHSINEHSMRQLYDAGKFKYDLFFDVVPKEIGGIPKTVIDPNNEFFKKFPEAAEAVRNSPTHMTIYPDFKELVFDHPVVEQTINEERVEVLLRLGLLSFYDLTPAQINAEYNVGFGGQIPLDFGGK